MWPLIISCVKAGCDAREGLSESDFCKTLS